MRTAFAVRTQRASLGQMGLFSNPYLLLAILAELLLAAIIVYAHRYRTCSPPPARHPSTCCSRVR